MKSGFVSIIGKPNVGKSTLLNRIIGEKIAITSKRPQTTRSNIMGILNEDDIQIVFIDTPGIHQSKNKLDSSMNKDIRQAREDADLVLHIVDNISDDSFDISADILILNKVDKLDKQKILPFLEANKNKTFEIFCISAKTGEGVDDLVKYIKEKIPEGEYFFPDGEITNQSPRALMSEYIREQAFRLIGDEIPFGIAVIVDKMKSNERDILEVEATIYCEKESHKSIIIGKNGSKLKEISTKARLAGERFFGKKIYLQTWVKVSPNWRDNEFLVNNYLGR